MNLTDNKQQAVRYVDENAALFTGVSDQIWEYAELSLKEFKSADLYCEKAAALGFEVTRGICNIDTAFVAKYGQGRPYIGILAEYDALSGLSQTAQEDHQCELVPGGCGHGCGHNLLGAGAFAAAAAVKDYLEKTKTPGTVFFYGCPGEEGGAAKAFMARENLWESLDAAITWHPGDTNEIMTGTNNSCIQCLYKFKGIAAHAAGNPQDGRSALDAVELMNIGVQYLREHASEKARIHYAIIDAGGFSPNVVQPTASVLYMVRSNKVREAIELQARVDKIAEGAAMMTETSFEKIFVDGTANTVVNSTLERALWDNMDAIGAPQYDEAEWALAKKIYVTHKAPEELPGTGQKHDVRIRSFVREKSDDGKRELNDFLLPFYSGNDFSPGSTDVGDVSWQTPTAQFTAVTQTAGSPGHSWQNVSIGKSGIAHKGMLYAGKILACTAIDLFETPELLEKAKQEFKEAAAEGYTCPIPDGVPPYVIE